MRRMLCWFVVLAGLSMVAGCRCCDGCCSMGDCFGCSPFTQSVPGPGGGP
jgi:hypothetical protein